MREYTLFVEECHDIQRGLQQTPPLRGLGLRGLIHSPQHILQVWKCGGVKWKSGGLGLRGLAHCPQHILQVWRCGNVKGFG